jgi:hypothetical protein
MSLLGLSTTGHASGTGGDVIINNYNLPLLGETPHIEIEGIINSQKLLGVIKIQEIEGIIE